MSANRSGSFNLKARLGGLGGKAASSFIIKSVGAGSAFALQIVLARLMDKTEYGNYTYVIAWISIAIIFAPLGVNRTAVKFIPTYIAQENYLTLRKYVRWMFTITIVSSIMLAVLVIDGVLFIPSMLDTSLKIALFIGCALIPVNTVVQLLIESMRAFRSIVFSEFSNAILRPMLIISAALTAHFIYGIRLNSGFLLSINIVSGVLIVFILTFCTLKLLKPLPRQQLTPVKMDTSAWFATAIPLLFVAGGNMIQGKADIVMLGAMSSTAASGLYNAASNITQLIGLPLLAINTILAPVIAQYYAQNRHDDLQKIVKKAAYWSFFANLGFAGIVFLGADRLLGLFGANFVSQADTLQILLFSQVVAGMSGPSGYLLSMTGNQRALALTVAACALLNIILNFLLIPIFDTAGAATATLISIATTNILNTIAAIKESKINPTIFPFKIAGHSYS